MSVAVDDLRGRTLKALSKLIRLANTTDPILPQLLALANSQDGELDTVFRDAATTAGDAYRAAGAQFAEHLAVIVQNNPGKTLQQIMGRVDVQQNLHGLFGTAYQAAGEAIRTGHATGAALALTHAQQEAAIYGLTIPAVEALGTVGTTDSILADLERNQGTASARITVGAQTGFGAALGPPEGVVGAPGENLVADMAAQRAAGVTDEVQRVANDLGMRAGAGASTATVSSYGDSKLLGFSALANSQPTVTVEKVWICSFDNSCPECVALHGTVLAVDQMFPEDVTFGNGDPDPSYDGLDAPPRHPYCGCQVCLFITDGGDAGVGFADVAAATGAADAMQSTAADYAAATAGMAPRTFPGDTVSEVARGTDTMLASDIQAATDAQFENSLGVFKGCILHQYGNG